MSVKQVTSCSHLLYSYRVIGSLCKQVHLQSAVTGDFLKKALACQQLYDFIKWIVEMIHFFLAWKCAVSLESCQIYLFFLKKQKKNQQKNL